MASPDIIKYKMMKGEYRENPKEYYSVKFVTEYILDDLPNEKDFLEDISKIRGFNEEE